MWDKEKKVMREVISLTISEGMTQTIIGHFREESEKGTYDLDLVAGESGELMQFTGLHDKNGKEIYEGDIVAVGSDEERTKHEVKWMGENYPAFDLVGWDTESNGLSEVLGSGEYGELEIVGNLFEHPHLLSK